MIIQAQEINRPLLRGGGGSVLSSPAFLVDLVFLDASDLSFLSDLSPWPGKLLQLRYSQQPLKHNSRINAEELNQQKQNKWVAKNHATSYQPVTQENGVNRWPPKGAPSPCDFPVPPAPWRRDMAKSYEFRLGAYIPLKK